MYSRNSQRTTYGSRKRHRSSSNPVPTSSPVKSAALLENETSITEMTRRMKKRSRAALRQDSGGGTTQSDGAEIDEENDEPGRPSKKRKGIFTDARAPLGERPVDRNAPSVPIQQYLDAHMEEEEDEEAIKTPAARSRPLLAQPTKKARETESLSPLPVSSRSRRVLKTRASSKYLKENVPQDTNPRSLLTSSSLASPFHSQHATPVTSPKPSGAENDVAASAIVENAQKNSRTKFGATRTRSAATTARHQANRSGPNSPSAHSSMHRRPSESNLQTKNKQQWLVPAQTGEIAKKRTAYRPSRLNQSFSREGSFFDGVPQACSTPMHPSRPVQKDSDMTPRLPFQHSNEMTPLVRDASMALDYETPRVSTLFRTSVSRALSNDSIFDGSISENEGSAGSIAYPTVHRKSMRRATVHIPEDSIFSSGMDISVSVDPEGPPASSSNVDPPQAIYAPPTSPIARGSPHSSEDGDELRDMFSILGLDEIGLEDYRFPDPIEPLSSAGTVQGPKRKPTALGARLSNLKHSITSIKSKKSSSVRQKHAPYPSISQGNIRAPKISPVRGTSGSGERPTLRMKILEKPLDPSSSPDELLLTSKGWKYGCE